MSSGYKWVTSSGSVELVAARKNIAGSDVSSDSLFEAAVACHQSGSLQEAEEKYQDVLAICPNHFHALHRLGVIHAQQKKYDLASDLIGRALEIEPEFVDALNNMGNIFYECEQPEKAVLYYQRALAIQPDYLEAHSNLGNTFVILGRLDEAASHYESALKINPDYAEAYANLANIFFERGQLDKAVSLYEHALRLKPDYARAQSNLGVIMKLQGHSERAEKCMLEAIALNPGYAEPYRYLALIRSQAVTDDHISAMENYLQQPTLSDEGAVHLNFALGKIYNDRKLYDKAFRNYAQGNQTKRKTVSYSPESHRSYIDQLIDVYSKEFINKNSIDGVDSELPVFIVGMPRSGTTLVEQIVSQHPSVHGAGELTYFSRLEQEIIKESTAHAEYPACIPFLSQDVFSDITEKYLLELRKLSKEAVRVTDKMPRNRFSIGLIKILFPKARIIYCKRDPLDTCLSNYFTYFSEANTHAYDLYDLGVYYSQHERLMEHWRSVLPGQLFEVQYEELVSHQEKISRQLIEYLGLEWDASCLRFYENTRAVNTASSSQVRQSMYSSSVARWKNYEEHIGPLQEGLSAGRRLLA